jgi:hypothetical protein
MQKKPFAELRKRLLIAAQYIPLGRTISILVLYERRAGSERGACVPLLVVMGRPIRADREFPLSTYNGWTCAARRIGGAPMTTALTVILDPFDYSAFDADTASNLRAQASRIRKRIGKATQDLIDIGRDLLSAKKNLVDHGAFIDWVESEVGIVRRTAQAYMALAKFAEDNGAAIALLPPTTAHRLAAKSAPPEIVSKVVAKALTGEVLPDRAVAEMILAAKSERTQLPEMNGFSRFKHYRKYCEPQEAQQEAGLARQNREKKTSEAAEVLLKSLGADGVALVIKVFAEEEWPWGLLSELRKRILLRKRARGATH